MRAFKTFTFLDYCAFLSFFTMHFRWNASFAGVTEPTSFTIGLRVVEAWVCEAMVAWSHMALRVRSY